MAEQEDRTLVARARLGDKMAFSDLIERHQHIAERIAVRIVGDIDIARELVQDAMLHAYLSLDHLRDDTRFKSWLYSIVLNVCRSYVRGRKNCLVSLEALTGDPQTIAEERELQERVLAAVNELSPKVKAATLLFYYQQLSLNEVAFNLGISLVTTKSRLHKARLQLKENLQVAYPEVVLEQRKKKMVTMYLAEIVQQQRNAIAVLVYFEPVERIDAPETEA